MTSRNGGVPPAVAVPVSHVTPESVDQRARFLRFEPEEGVITEVHSDQKS